MRGVAMGIAIHTATVANGTMHVIPRSQHMLFDHARDGGSDHHLTCTDRIDESQAIAVELPAGGVLFFSYGLPHCTKANRTDGDRAGLALLFQDAAIPAPENSRRSPIISGPDCQGGRESYDEDLRGLWEELVDLITNRGMESTAGLQPQR